jgi:hypothetical protein
MCFVNSVDTVKPIEVLLSRVLFGHSLIIAEISAGIVCPKHIFTNLNWNLVRVLEHLI